MIFVTGASGFIGRYVVETFEKSGQQVIALVRDKERYQIVGTEIVMEGDLLYPDAIKKKLDKYSIDTCIHLAWEGIPDYSYDWSKKNLLYGMNVLELCRDSNIKNLIITGSCWEYEAPSGKIPEEAPLSYGNHFKAAKNSLRMICDAFCKEFSIHYNWLRLFYVYGAGQREGSLIPHIIKEFKEGRQPSLNGAYNENDFIYVGDVADAIVKCEEYKPKEKVINIGSGKAVRVLDIVKMAGDKLHIEVDSSLYVKFGQITSFYADTKLMAEALKWESCISINEGIDIMING